ncbi:MAG: spore cortex-lytic enzyme [Clostridia bacterium]|nr:spore cortex-lytic enzyme [Clostridia bacterium]MBQ5742708.1 spore cortex-lytic enzyme [Clostridia bacterium]
MAVLLFPPATEEAFSQFGSTGTEVRQIQTALKKQGYYNGSVDGVYGSQTRAAVRKFQAAKGLTVDGICGNATLSALGIGGSSTSLRKGSTGSGVRQVQQKLSNWGYYTGKIDGIYGSGTESAVRKFQRNNGLTSDGICGVKTLSALGLSSVVSSSHTASASNGDVYLLARIISAEARGESYRGQVAVGAVVMNRVESSQFPNTLAGVIYQKGAFTAIDDGQFNQPIADSAYRAAREVLAGADPTGGCLYYYNPVTATSKWIYSLPVKMTIGKHRFSMGK